MDTRQTRPIILTVPVFEDFRGSASIRSRQARNHIQMLISQGLKQVPTR